MQKPKVSFICSVRNGSEYLKRCVSSVLNQTLKEIELILIDDHSTDNTWEIINKLSKLDSRIIVMQNHKNQGISEALNLGIDVSKGEFIARIDVDDFVHNERTKKQVEFIESNEDVAMVTSRYRVVDSNDWLLYEHGPPSDPVSLRWSLCFRNFIRHSTVMWKKSLNVRYDTNFSCAQDYELWCRISRMGNIGVVSEILATITDRPESISNKMQVEQELAADRVVAQQWNFYTNRIIQPKDSNCLRMIHHMKSPNQFEVFKNMKQIEFQKALTNYFIIVSFFLEKENIEPTKILSEINNDVISILNDPEKKDQAINVMSLVFLELKSEKMSEVKKFLQY